MHGGRDTDFQTPRRTETVEKGEGKCFDARGNTLGNFWYWKSINTMISGGGYGSYELLREVSHSY